MARDNHENDRTPHLRGTAAAYAHARLRKDRPDIHARVLNGEISPHAGMIEAGYRKPKASRRTPLQRAKALLQKLLPELTTNDRDELRRMLDE